MNMPTKSTALQAYRLILYRRALHPELFRLVGRRTIRHLDYDFEAWILPAGHVLRFQYDGTCASEVITEQEDGIPERGVVSVIPCAGDRDHEEAFGDDIKYVATVQTEQLNESLFRATYEELVEFGQENDALIHLWEDEGGRNASILDIQRYRREVHVQSYHMLAQGGLVLRTQSIFEHTN